MRRCRPRQDLLEKRATRIAAAFLILHATGAFAGASLITSWTVPGGAAGLHVSGTDVWAVVSPLYQLYRFDLQGTVLGVYSGRTSGLGGLSWGGDMDSDCSGNLYVPDTHRIQEFDALGNPLRDLADDNWTVLDLPAGVAISPQGEIYIADTGHDRIIILAPDGSYRDTLGTTGSGPGEFYAPTGIAFTSSGEFFVSDFGNNRIQGFTSSKDHAGEWGHLGSEPGQFNCPDALDIGPDQRVYVTDRMNNRVQVFEPDGTFVTEWGNQPLEEGQLNEPISISVDDAGLVYVGDSNGIQVFAVEPTPVESSTWGSIKASPAGRR